MTTIDSLKNSAIGDSNATYYEKKLTDMNDVDEIFSNARDLGHSRLNYSRLTAIGNLAEYDKVDIYKTTVISNRGKLSISLQNSTDSEKVLDLTKYEQYLDQLKKQTDPEGYAKEQEEKLKKQAEQNSLELTAPGMRLEVYSVNRQGKEVLIADSAAELGTDERTNMEALLSGDYSAAKGVYYIKVSREESNTSTDTMPYAMQIKMGDTYKQDYVAIEQDSEDTKNKKNTKVPLTNSNGTLSTVNALQVQASKYQATAQMLKIGYQNLASIYAKNNKL